MLKFIAAALIFSALFLPLSSCERYVTPEGTTVHYLDREDHPVPPDQGQPIGATPVQEVAKLRALPFGIKPIREYQFLLDDFRPKNLSSWIPPMAFIWPICLLLILLLFRRNCNRKRLFFITPILLFWSGYTLQSYSLGERYEIGYWTTLTGIALFGLHSAREVVPSFSISSHKIAFFAKSSIYILMIGSGLIFPAFISGYGCLTNRSTRTSPPPTASPSTHSDFSSPPSAPQSATPVNSSR